MHPAPSSAVPRVFVPTQTAASAGLEASFNLSLRHVQELPAERRTDALIALLKSIDALGEHRQLPVLSMLAITTAAIPEDRFCEVGKLLIDKFQAVSRGRSADQRHDDAVTFSNALLSAAQLQTTDTFLKIVEQLLDMTRTLPANTLAAHLISITHQQLITENASATCRNLAQAARLVRTLPAELRLDYLDRLRTLIPDHPASRSQALPELLNQVAYVPWNHECQSLIVSMNQSLYQSRLAEQS